MNRKIIQSRKFKKNITDLLDQKKILNKDFEELKTTLIENPLLGDLIRGTGGVRKIRLKSSTGGKSGGFRICYYYFTRYEEILLMLIYSKNVQADLTSEQKNF